MIWCLSPLSVYTHLKTATSLLLVVLVMTSYQSVTAQIYYPEFLIGGNGGELVLYKEDGTIESLTDSLATSFNVTSIKYAFGFYVIGLSDEPLGEYQSPASGKRIVRYLEGQLTNAAPQVTTVQIMDVDADESKFLVGGYYHSTGGGYGYGRLYEYDGVTTTDATTQVLGGTSKPEIHSLCYCDDYWLIGVLNCEQNYGYLYKYAGGSLTTIMELYPVFGTGVYPSEIAWNGAYALFGTNYGGYIVTYDGVTTTDLTSEAGFDALDGIYDIDWNGAYWLIAGGSTQTGYKLKSYGSSFTDLSYLKFNDVGWNDRYWLLGGSLYQFDGSRFTDVSKAIDFSPNVIEEGGAIPYVRPRRRVSPPVEVIEPPGCWLRYLLMALFLIVCYLLFRKWKKEHLTAIPTAVLMVYVVLAEPCSPYWIYTLIPLAVLLVFFLSRYGRK